MVAERGAELCVYKWIDRVICKSIKIAIVKCHSRRILPAAHLPQSMVSIKDGM